MSVSPGQTLGRYRVIEQIGEGGMGVVFRAWDSHLERDVAIKVLPAGLLGNEQARRRLRREALALSQLNHPNIGVIFDFDSQEDHDYIVMEHVSGVTVRQRIHTSPMAEEEIIRFGFELCEGLHAAHESNLVHRDIKPGNLMITTEDRLKILDFGLVRLIAIPCSATTESLSQGAVGTPIYMAPEQMLGGKVDRRADVYGAGCVLYEMTTGTPPFAPRDPEALAYSVVNSRPEPPRRRNPKLSPGLQTIILKALEKNPRRRFQTANEMAAALQALPDSPSISVPLPAFLTGWRGWLAASLIVVAALAVAAWQFLPGDDAPVNTRDATRLRIGVLLPPEARSETAQDWPNLIQAMLSEGLSGTENVAVVDPFSLNGLIVAALGTDRPPRDSTLHELLRDEQIDLVIDTNLVAGTNEYRIVSNLVDPAAGEVHFTSTATFANEPGLLASIEDLSARTLSFVNVEIRPEEDTRHLGPWISDWSRDVEAIQAFLLASRYAHRNEMGAATHLLRASQIDPDFIAPRIWLISGHVQAGNIEQAVEHHRQLLALESDATPFEQAMIGWAGASVRGDLPGQERHLEVALEYSPGNNIVQVNLSETRLFMGDFEGAYAASKPLVDARFRFPGIYPVAAKSLIMLEREQEAHEVLSVALQISPVDPEVYGLLEGLAIRNGDTEGATRYRQLRDARVAEVPEEAAPTKLEPLYRILGERCRDSGQPERAEKLFARADQEPSVNEDDEL